MALFRTSRVPVIPRRILGSHDGYEEKHWARRNQSEKSIPRRTFIACNSHPHYQQPMGYINIYKKANCGGGGAHKWGRMGKEGGKSWGLEPPSMRACPGELQFYLIRCGRYHRPSVRKNLLTRTWTYQESRPSMGCLEDREPQSDAAPIPPPCVLPTADCQQSFPTARQVLQILRYPFART